MTWNSAFPSSPLSRSALRGDSRLLGGPTCHQQQFSHDASDPLDQGQPSPTSLFASTSAAQSHLSPPRFPSGPPSSFRALIGQTSTSSLSPAPPSPPPSHLDPLTFADRRRSFQELAPDDPVAQPCRSISGPPSLLSVSAKTAAWSPQAPRMAPRVPTWSPEVSSSPPLGHYHQNSPPSRSVWATRRRPSAQSSAVSPSPNFGSLIGSYEESLLRGRMSTPASKPLTFDAELGVLGLGKCRPSLRCPPHLNLKFPAYFYDLKRGPQTGDSPIGTPYVGTVDLESHYYDDAVAAGIHSIQIDENQAVPFPAAASSSALPSFPGYRVPPKGQIQLVIKNPNLTAVKLFLVPYDLTDMPAGTKTFIRQKSLATVPLPGTEAVKGSNHDLAAKPPYSPLPSPSLSPSSLPRSNHQSPRAPSCGKETMRYAIHLQFCAPPAPTSKPKRSDPGFGGRDGLSTLCRSRSGDDGHGTAASLAFDHKESRTTRPSSSERDATTTLSPSDSAPTPASAAAPPTKIYLHKTIRVVFAARAPDRSERLHMVTETPGVKEGRYAPYAGPGNEWSEIVREAKLRARAHRKHGQRSSKVPADDAPTATDVPTTKVGLGLEIGSHREGQAGRAIDVANVVRDRDGEAVYAYDLPNSDPNGERWGSGPGDPNNASLEPLDIPSTSNISIASAWSSGSSRDGPESFSNSSSASQFQSGPTKLYMGSSRTADSPSMMRHSSQESFATRGGSHFTRVEENETSGHISSASSILTMTASQQDRLGQHTLAPRSRAGSSLSNGSGNSLLSGAIPSGAISPPSSILSGSSTEEDRALLEAWHQTWRRLPSFSSGISSPSQRPASPAHPRSTSPNSSSSSSGPPLRPMSPHALMASYGPTPPLTASWSNHALGAPLLPHAPSWGVDVSNALPASTRSNLSSSASPLSRLSSPSNSQNPSAAIHSQQQ
ncbi:hypothetical protein IE53DRAFT_388170 [Violaceomyces palustris]|uniref:Uncharacterized protein n=1 Tax=Violaceomyces palustris TaxID=1673888 RepID=A0ACD0NUR5_9BASI|nr:hypothetical protein IE53DRAFT_388170 [Violaceomyces palustris]